MTEQPRLDDTSTDATVVYLPATHTGRDLTAPVEAEIVVEQPRPTSGYRILPTEQTRQQWAERAVQLHHTATPAAVTCARHVARHSLYVAAGLAVAAKRVRDARGVSRYERALQAAEMDGDWGRAAEWEEREARAKRERHERRMDWVKAPIHLAKALVLTSMTGMGFLLTLGIVLAVAGNDLALILQPVRTVMEAIAWAWWVATAYGALLLGGAGLAATAWLHHLGRTRSTWRPTWLEAQVSSHEAISAALDESMIMNALRHLGHAELNRKMRDGWGSTIMPSWVQPPLPVGTHGWEFALRLPGGVPASSISKRKDVLAHNLGRRPEEVWVETDESDPMAMRCYVLNPGALRDPVPAYPLLEEGGTNFWTGVPVGINARREAVITSVFERNFVIAGIMGSGKTSQIQTLLAGLALDPLVDIDVFCFAENNDYEWLRPVATVHMGAGEQRVEACLDYIEGRYDGLAAKGQALKEHGVPSVTRAAAEKDDRLRPRVIVIDECQALFRQDDPKDRKAVENMLINFMTTARKYAEVLIFATPTPSDRSLPRDLVSVATNRACHAIGDKTRNNIVLGDKAHENGLSALGLKPAKKVNGKIVALNDVGTSITIGYMDEPGLLRSYNLDDDEKAQVIARAVQLRGGAAQTADALEPERRDLLADVAAVLTGSDEVPAAQVADALRTAHPRYRPYRGLTKKTLAEALRDRGVEVPTTGNRYPVDPQTVRDALAAAATTGNEDEDE